jgi:hypothetical protein
MMSIRGKSRKVHIVLTSNRCSSFSFLHPSSQRKSQPFSPTPSPSDIVLSSHKQAELVGGNKPSIHLGRPGGVPAAIFNPALAMLRHRLDHLEQVHVSRGDVECAARYLRCAVEFYDNEDLCQRAIKDLVDGAIGETGEWERSIDWADKIKPGGGWWYDTFLILVLELKNALGLSGALFQAVVDYSKIISREKVQFLISAASGPRVHLCLQYRRR